MNKRLMMGIAGAMLVSGIMFKAGEIHAQQHPRLVNALGNLAAARDLLVAAPDVFGGHKANAIAATNTAIAEVNAALAFAAQTGH